MNHLQIIRIVTLLLCKAMDSFNPTWQFQRGSWLPVVIFWFSIATRRLSFQLRNWQVVESLWGCPLIESEY